MMVSFESNVGRGEWCKGILTRPLTAQLEAPQIVYFRATQPAEFLVMEYQRGILETVDIDDLARALGNVPRVELLNKLAQKDLEKRLMSLMEE